MKDNVLIKTIGNSEAINTHIENEADSVLQITANNTTGQCWMFKLLSTTNAEKSLRYLGLPHGVE
jgi:predicted secreted protein